MTIFPSLVCPGTDIDGSVLSSLNTLDGLQVVMDGSPSPGCLFRFFSVTGLLVNVSALAAFGRCGASNQRPDQESAPCLNVYCGVIYKWSTLCNYVALLDSGTYECPP
jgi:hypothetical protein